MGKTQSKSKGCLGCSGVLGIGIIVLCFIMVLCIIGTEMNQSTVQDELNSTDVPADGKKHKDRTTEDTASNDTEKQPEEKYIPGLAAVEVYPNFTKKGYSLYKDSHPIQSVWRCTKERAGDKMMVEVFGASPTRITLVRATYSNWVREETDQGSRQFLAYAAASVPYAGSRPKRAQSWVKKNIGKNARTTIGGVSFELIANLDVPLMRMLLIQPVSDAERERAERKKVTDPEKKAASKLILAKQLLKKNKSSGKKWLQDIVKDYPGTAAAKEAEELLKGL